MFEDSGTRIKIEVEGLCKMDFTAVNGVKNDEEFAAVLEEAAAMLRAKTEEDKEIF